MLLRTESLKVVIDTSLHELSNLARLTVDFAPTLCSCRGMLDKYIWYIKYMEISLRSQLECMMVSKTVDIEAMVNVQRIVKIDIWWYILVFKDQE